MRRRHQVFRYDIQLDARRNTPPILLAADYIHKRFTPQAARLAVSGTVTWPYRNVNALLAVNMLLPLFQDAAAFAVGTSLACLD